MAAVRTHSGAPRPRASMRDRSVAVLVVSQFISLLGSHMSMVALPWFVLSTTGSPGMMTAVLIAEALPYVLVGIPAGALVDRSNLRRLLIVLDGSRAFVTAAIPILALTGRLEFWMILMLTAIQASMTAPYLAAKQALIPRLVDGDEIAVTRVNSLLQVAVQTTFILGPVTAGALIALWGNETVLAIDAGTFLVGALLLCGIRRVPQPRSETASGGVWRETRDGFMYLRHNPVLWRVTLMGVLATVGYYLALAAGLPVFVRDVLHGGPGTLGWLFGVWGVGAMAGLAGLAFLRKRLVSGNLEIASVLFAIIAAAMWLPPLVQGLAFTLTAFVVAGMADGPVTALLNTILQLESEPSLRGRVFSAFFAACMAVIPVVLLVTAPVLERWGSVPVMTAAAAVFTLAAGLGMSSSVSARRRGCTSSCR